MHAPFEVFAAKRARSRPRFNAQETEKWTRADNQPGEISEKHSFRIASFSEGNEASYLLFRRLSSLTAKKESRVELPLTCTRFSCRCLGLAWMLAATGVSGQTTTPSGPITTPVANGPSVSPATQADQMIARIRGAMTEKDYHTAVQGFRTASQQSGYSPVQVAELQKLRKQLEQIGIDPALLALPMPAMTAEAKKKEACG